MKRVRTLLIIGFTWPEPNATAAGNRMLQILRFFLRQDYQITFSSTASESSLSLDLEEMGIQKVPIRLNHSSFDVFVKELQPDIVLFDRFLTEEQFGSRITECVPDAVRVLDTEDLHSLRKAREEAFKSGIEFSTDYWLQTDLCKRELASIFRADLSLIISSYELKLLKEVVKMEDSILQHLPFLLESIKPEEIERWLSFEKRKNFVCIGNGKHAPNVDAILWLKKEIWPLIREKLPTAKLHIYGAYLPEHVLQLHNEREGFMVKGWAADLIQVMQNARVNLVPLRFGAGLKGKLIDAMQNGTPSTSTSIGTEGMLGGLEFSGYVENDAAAFAARAVQLFLNKRSWEVAQKNGVEIINTHYDSKILENQLYTKIKKVAKQLKKHRMQNVIGQLLIQQSMASTKYMTKWIEEKNKNKHG